MTVPGGAGDGGPRIVDGPLDAAPLVRDAGDPASGALVVLTTAGAADALPGADLEGDDDVRGEGGSAPSGRAGLERAVREVESRALERFRIRSCRLQLRPAASDGETAVLAVVRAPHRAAAFDAASWATASVLDPREEADVPGHPERDG